MMPQIFDFVNVNNIHNATFHNELPPTFREQAYGFANFHEDGVFTDVSPIGIGNSAFTRRFLSCLSKGPSALQSPSARSCRTSSPIS
jgi:prostatic aicd phosphatase